ncbi:MAG: nucleotide exchange factor GrpE [Phycisphaeraceae bacterium]|nr:nucleotide exchange factor GrpE [Phycisphaeraceae bacterium]
MNDAPNEKPTQDSSPDETSEHDPIEDLRETEHVMEKLETERDELFSRLQRVSADYQNYMKRAERELTEGLAFARGDLLKQFIPLLDVMDQALQKEPESEEAIGVLEGMKIVRDEFSKVLSQLGVERIDPERGENFDPHLHEAMMQQPDESLEPNQIAQALQPGYVYKGRTLRPAKVSVVPENAG